MKSSASPLLQPLPVDPLIKFLGTVTGRDKVYRTVQYFARFYTWYLTKNHPADKDALARWTAAKSVLGTGRKMIRLGKPIEHIQAILKSHSIRDDAIRLLVIFKNLSYTVYLFHDMLSWFHSTKIKQFTSIQTIQERAARFWLFGIFFSWLSGIYQLRLVAQRYVIVQRAVRAKGADPAPEEIKLEVSTLRRERSDILRQLFQDTLDMMIPAYTLKYIDVEEGVIGIAGMITGAMGAESQWRKVNGGK